MAVKDVADRTTEAIEIAIGNAEPTHDRPPDIVTPEDPFITVGRKGTDRSELKNYAAKIVHGVLRLFHF